MRHVPLIWFWAARDLIRNPFESIFLALALSSLIIIASASLLLCRGISETAERLLEQGPSVVVRRVVSGNWAPVPVEDAVKAAFSVPGVLSATPRIWGVIAGPEGPVTVMGIPWSNTNMPGIYPDLAKLPEIGEAVIGPGVLFEHSDGKIDTTLVLSNGPRELTLTVAGVLPVEHGMTVHDVVLLNEQDARHILELEIGFASDLAIDVFHEQEANAILPDLAEAFSWPVSLTTKNDTLKMYNVSAARRSGLIYLAMIPSLPALAVIVTAGFKGTRGRMHEAGLFKSMGWTTKDIVGFFMCRAAWIAFPSCAFGMAVAYALVYTPGITWPGYLFFGWHANAPGLYLDPAGSLRIFLQVIAGVLVPYFASNLWPAIENATADPYQLLQEAGGW